MIAALTIGCGKAKQVSSNNEPASAKNAAAKPKIDQPIAIAMEAANNKRVVTVCFLKAWFFPRRDKLWFIEWQSANLIIDNGIQSGNMFKVKGKAFENGAVASTFSADHAEADKVANRLILDGGITITSDMSKEKGKTNLTAKKVEWMADIKVYKASGDVVLDGPQGVVGPVDVLYVSPKLSRVATSLKYFKQ